MWQPSCFSISFYCHQMHKHDNLPISVYNSNAIKFVNVTTFLGHCIILTPHWHNSASVLHTGGKWAHVGMACNLPIVWRLVLTGTPLFPHRAAACYFPCLPGDPPGTLIIIIPLAPNAKPPRDLLTFAMKSRADSRLAPSQWEMALLCKNVSHWLGQGWF